MKGKLVDDYKKQRQQVVKLKAMYFKRAVDFEEEGIMIRNWQR